MKKIEFLYKLIFLCFITYRIVYLFHILFFNSIRRMTCSIVQSSLFVYFPQFLQNFKSFHEIIIKRVFKKLTRYYISKIVKLHFLKMRRTSANEYQKEQRRISLQMLHIYAALTIRVIIIYFSQNLIVSLDLIIRNSTCQA